MDLVKNILPWKKFPDTQTLGFYTMEKFFIYLAEYEDEVDFENSYLNLPSDKKRYSVYIHERQHYIDSVSTLWGINRFYDLYQAYDAFLKYSEPEFHKFRTWELNCRRDFLTDYYTENYNNIRGDFKSKWKFKHTLGYRFSHDGKVDKNSPIFFIVFSSKEDEEITRVPFSVLSLLETTATYREYEFLLNQLTTPQQSELDEISKKFEDLLYSPELVIYSAAVHFVSGLLKIDNPIMGYRFSSLFAKIALNIPSVLLSKINIEQFPFPKEDAKKMLDNKERGFVFYLLVINFVSQYGTKLEYAEVDNILEASNLPPEEDVEKLIKQEISELDGNILMSKNNLRGGFMDKYFFGTKFREATGIGQQKSIKNKDLSKFEKDKPFLYFSETQCFSLQLEPIIGKLKRREKLDFSEWMNFVTKFEERLYNFTSICGI